MAGARRRLATALVAGDLAEPRTPEALQAFRFDAVMHFAGYIQVGESVAHPG
jgi:UDP-glucose 4-epimerase